MIIGVSGYAGSGKDTVGELIQYVEATDSGFDFYGKKPEFRKGAWNWEEISGWEIKKWAGKLKVIASILTGIPVKEFEDRDFKESYLGDEWDYCVPYESDAPWVAEGETTEVRMSVREFLQKLGTEGLRDGLHKNVWVNALMADYKAPKMDQRNPSKWIITDTRFPNEAQAIKDKRGIIIRVERPGVDPTNLHESETALDDYPFDYVIVNDGSIKDLEIKVREILIKQKLNV